VQSRGASTIADRTIARGYRPAWHRVALMECRRPTRAELRAAVNKTVPDVVGRGLRVLFCGINPGLYSGATGHHFARPGNRFWGALRDARFTPRQLQPWQERELRRYGLGVTNLVRRTTATAAEIEPEELRAGRKRLERVVRRYRPRVVAVVGIGAYRVAFDRPHATHGPQTERLAGARVWVLPNPSGLNANYQVRDFARLFRALRRSLDRAGEAGAV
jgi:double-stranded uracil-DNA glycosylase